MRKQKNLTYTSQITEQLRSTQDFLSVQQIAERVGCTMDRAISTLIYLRYRHVADVVVNADGKGWWFALPTCEDNRLREIKERALETHPRAKKKVKV